MTKNIAAFNPNTAFTNLFTLANTLQQVLANEIVTANNAPGGGAMTAGNGFVTGIFGSNTLVGTTLQGGNVTSTSVIWMGSNLNMNTQTLISGNVVVNNTIVEVGANVVLNTTAVLLGNSTVNSTITTTTAVVANSTSQTAITPLSVAIGNTTANVFANSIVHIVANSTAQTVTTPFSIAFGNTTVNSSINSSAVAVGSATGNVSVNTIALTLGNSIANATLSTTLFAIGNSSVNAVTNSTGIFFNGTQLAVTSGGTNTNIQFSDSGAFAGTNAFSFIKTSNTVTIQNNVSIGNSTVNATLNSTSFTVGSGLFIANTSYIFMGGNSYISTSAMVVQNSVVYGEMFAGGFVTGNTGQYSSLGQTILYVGYTVASGNTATINTTSIQVGNSNMYSLLTQNSLLVGVGTSGVIANSSAITLNTPGLVSTVNNSGYFYNNGSREASAAVVAYNAFGASQTVTVPAGATKAFVRMCGGGGGINHGYNLGGAGGAGGYLEKLLTGLTPGLTLALTLGAGGIGSSGTNGGNSTLASGTQAISTLTASGGSTYGGGFGSTGGGATGGDFNLTGGQGYGVTFVTADGSGSVGGGVGGTNPLTTTGTGGLINQSGGYWGGGGAGDGSNSNGAPGVCLITWYA